METIVVRACGLDVHKDSIVACIMRQGVQKQIRTFGATTEDLQELSAWLRLNKITDVAMESTGIYWKPVINILGDDFNILLVNAREIKQVPGRKTDVKDCEWICKLLRAGLLRGSFIPPESIRHLRALTRYQKKLRNQIINEKNRLHKVLQEANIKLSSVLSDVFGVAGRKILRDLIAGRTEVADLENYLNEHHSLRAKKVRARSALNGRCTPEHQRLLGYILDHIEFIEKQLEKIGEQRSTMLRPYQQEYECLQTIPGIKQQAAATVLAEIGVDMNVFPTAAHLVSWAGLSPGQDKTAAKQRSSRLKHGNVYLRAMMVECAWVSILKRNSVLRAKYYSLVPRIGKKKAIIAIARKLLIICYHVIKHKENYEHREPDYLVSDRAKDNIVRKHLRQLQKLGVSVSVENYKAQESSTT